MLRRLTTAESQRLVCRKAANYHCRHRSTSSPVALGIDFGTDSVRCMLVDLHGNLVGPISSCTYAAGTISRRTGGGVHKGLELAQLPLKYCLQDADDWLVSLNKASKDLREKAGVCSSRIQSIGVSFTASTVLPCDAKGTPLFKTDAFHGRHSPHAW